MRHHDADYVNQVKFAPMRLRTLVVRWHSRSQSRGPFGQPHGSKALARTNILESSGQLRSRKVWERLERPYHFRFDSLYLIRTIKTSPCRWPKRVAARTRMMIWLKMVTWNYYAFGKDRNPKARELAAVSWTRSPLWTPGWTKKRLLSTANGLNKSRNRFYRMLNSRLPESSYFS